MIISAFWLFNEIIVILLIIALHNVIFSFVFLRKKGVCLSATTKVYDLATGRLPIYS